MVMIYDFRFLLDQHSELVIYSGSSLKWKSAGRHVAPRGKPEYPEKTTDLKWLFLKLFIIT
jgi:hypothetical protein